MMKHGHLLGRSVALSAVLALALTGCSGAQNGGGGPKLPADGCYVHLFDGNDFDLKSDNYVLTRPGRYTNLSSLPGTNKDWTGDADSLRVGSAATVTGWSRTNFTGTSAIYTGGSAHPDIADEPESLELICN